MKVLVVCALLVACASAGKVSNIAQKFIPSFAQGYIIRGQDAKPHSAPYIVSLSRTSKNYRHICGGTLINKSWIVTAALCIGKPVGMGVVAGLHKRTSLDEKTQSRVVDYGKVHESYTGFYGPYDIAILHVSQPFDINEWVQPAVLPAPEEIHAGETHLYGWGETTSYAGLPVKTLQTVTTKIVEFNQCKATLPADAPIHETNVCSDTLMEGISACDHDSGGPLVIERNNTPAELIGIVSWGYVPCGVAKMPSIYTRVSAYISWISKAQTQFYLA